MANNKNINDENQNLENSKQISIELPEEIAGGIYSNLAIIAHSPAEFVIDFTRLLPGIPKGKVQSRIIMTPQHLKLFTNALVENIHKYESEFGEIKLEKPNDNFMSFSNTIN